MQEHKIDISTLQNKTWGGVIIASDSANGKQLWGFAQGEKVSFQVLREGQPYFTTPFLQVAAKVYNDEVLTEDEQRECHGLDTPYVVGFYPDEFYPLCNFSPFAMVWREKHFPTSEHVYQWEKFNYASDDKQRNDELFVIRYNIKGAESAHRAFTIGRDNSGLVHPLWEKIKIPTMKDILLAKYEQHEYVRNKLFKTGQRKIQERSWRDDFWGTGPDGNGQNWLGKLWVQIREEKKSEMALWVIG